MGNKIFTKSDYRFACATLAQNGDTVVAVALKCSQNIDKNVSWGYSEIVSKVSKDGGATWSDEKVIATPPARKITAEADNTKSAFFLEPKLVATNGGFEVICTFYPESMGAEEEKLLDKKKIPYASFNGKTCQLIYDRDGNYYIVTDEGIIDSAKQKTEFEIRGFGDFYQGEEYQGNIYLNGAMGKNDEGKTTSFGAPMKAPKRSYIFEIKSADGENWSEPKDITAQILASDDDVCIATGEGSAVVLESGRIVVPMTSAKGAFSIYSDDGESWNRNFGFPYMPVKNSVSLVQAPSGELLALGKKSCISYDNAITWIKYKTKIAPTKAIADGDKIYTIVQAKDNTALIGGSFAYKKEKFKGIDFDKDSSALAGTYLKKASLALIGGKLTATYITQDNTEVETDTVE
ncbi:MAG: exo-alpha-sialidase [Eubacterium sp.]|nr:exo-alpha-sialidase [Eubacterium sp.]